MRISEYETPQYFGKLNTSSEIRNQTKQLQQEAKAALAQAKQAVKAMILGEECRRSLINRSYRRNKTCQKINGARKGRR
ncbi:MAG: hypothetical protein GY796_08200 [Chloroflexi bacterium]|nr:hypothetical protein [Chloroflexota bacterium]